MGQALHKANRCSDSPVLVHPNSLMAVNVFEDSSLDFNEAATECAKLSMELPSLIEADSITEASLAFPLSAIGLEVTTGSTDWIHNGSTLSTNSNLWFDSNNPGNPGDCVQLVGNTWLPVTACATTTLPAVTCQVPTDVSYPDGRVCPSGQFEQTIPDGDTDRSCASCSACSAGFEELNGCTDTTNTECRACEIGKFSTGPASSCERWDSCNVQSSM